MYSYLLSAVAGLLLGATATYAQTLPYPAPVPSPPSPPSMFQVPPGWHGRYWVQIRQPYWRVQQFDSQADLDAFIANQEDNGWQLQIVPPSSGGYAIRYRLNHWAGSRLMSSLDAAQHWAAHLAAQGYQARIVPHR